MNITFAPLKGKPNTIIGTWKLESCRGFDIVEEQEITLEQLEMYVKIHYDLKYHMARCNDLCLEEYCEPLAKKYNFDQRDLARLLDGHVVRCDPAYDDFVAQIEEFRAVKFDEYGNPHTVMFENSSYLK